MDTNTSERRLFQRINYATPLAYKVCNKDTVSKLLEGYTSNISQAGILCNIKEQVNQDDILWLSFNRETLEICEELEKRALIYQKGVLGKVVRIEPRGSLNFDVGIKFITREEKSWSNVFE
jgi:hypothetical protein